MNYYYLIILVYAWFFAGAQSVAGTEGISEKMVFAEFNLAYGIEISDETKETMDMFGHLRRCVVNERKEKMRNHMKLSVQECRIFFKYINGKIYFGHSGGHLRTCRNR